MGRKKIKIQSIKDDRNRQVKLMVNLSLKNQLKKSFQGYIFKKKAWINEESL